MVEKGSLNFKTVSFDNKPWYEIDTLVDLTEAEKLFPMEIKKTGILDYGIQQNSKILNQFPQKNKTRESKLAAI